MRQSSWLLMIDSLNLYYSPGLVTTDDNTHTVLTNTFIIVFPLRNCLAAIIIVVITNDTVLFVPIFILISLANTVEMRHTTTWTRWSRFSIWWRRRRRCTVHITRHRPINTTCRDSMVFDFRIHIRKPPRQYIDINVLIR